MGASNYVHLPVAYVMKLTDKAALVVLADQASYWFPFGQMADGEVDKLKEGACKMTLSVTAWICGEKGIDPGKYEDYPDW